MRQLELADQHTARSGDRKAQAIGAGRQRQRQVGDQQRFADLRLAAHKQNALRGQQARFDQAGRRSGRLLLQKLRQREDRGGWGVRHSSASLVASSRMASSTMAALRAAARRRAVRASLLTLRKMPLVA